MFDDPLLIFFLCECCKDLFEYLVILLPMLCLVSCTLLLKFTYVYLVVALLNLVYSILFDNSYAHCFTSENLLFKVFLESLISAFWLISDITGGSGSSRTKEEEEALKLHPAANDYETDDSGKGLIDIPMMASRIRVLPYLNVACLFHVSWSTYDEMNVPWSSMEMRVCKWGCGWN